MDENGPILEFEKPIYELEKRIEEMRNYAVTENLDALADAIRTGPTRSTTSTG